MFGDARRLRQLRASLMYYPGAAACLSEACAAVRRRARRGRCRQTANALGERGWEEGRVGGLRPARARARAQATLSSRG